MPKPLSPRQISKQENKKRRENMVIKVISFNIQENKLSTTKKEYFKLLHLESKLYYNYILYQSEFIVDNFGNYVSPTNIFEFDYKPNTIEITWYNEPQYYELQVLTSQMKQEILNRIKSSIKGLSAAKKKGRKIGKLKYKRIVNTPLSQFNSTYYLSDDFKYLRLQGSKLRFKLVRNKNINNLSNNLHLGKPSLKKLVDLGIIELASAEIQGNKFNLTVYFNVQALKDAGLYQGSRLPELNDISIGIDAGIKSELTINTGDMYSAIEIDSRKGNKINRLKKYQRRFNRHISKCKKNNTKIKTNKYYDLNTKVNNLYTGLTNSKVDKVNKVVSVLKECKVVSFQDENIKSWAHNSVMGFSKKVQKGILGRVYSKLRILSKEDNRFVMLKRSLATTKTCDCGCVNYNITLKDRVYYCLHCGYENNRDIHSSWIIRKWNSIPKIVSGVDTKVYESKSNLGKMITTAKLATVEGKLDSKLKSKSLQIRVVKHTLEAPCFSSG